MALAFLLMTGVLCSMAQLVNNGRFEDWTVTNTDGYVYDSCHYWKTTELFSLQNSGNANHSAQQETSVVHDGASSLRLNSWSTTGFPVNGLPGCASNGDVSVILFPPSVSPIGGVPDVVRHGILNGYYMYNPAGADQGSIETCLFKRNGATRDTIAYGAFNVLLNIGTYTHFSVYLTEKSAGTPDSSLIWIQSSPRSPIGSGVTGTILRVDSIYYSSLIGINEASSVVRTFLTYPVPAVNEINAKVELVNPVEMTCKIHDQTGRLVASEEMSGTEMKMNIHHLAAGNYILSLHDQAGNKLCAHNFSIVR